MIGRTSSATEKALKLHAKGHSIREAAKLAGVAPSTLFRALKKKGGGSSATPNPK